MKRWLWISFVVVFSGVVFSSCLDEGEDYYAEEKIKIDAYLKISPYQFEKQSSGLYYSKLEEGSGEKPVNGDFVVFSYVGRILGRSSVFDTSIKDTAINYGIYYKNRYYAPLYTPLVHAEYPTRRLVFGLEEGLKLMSEGERAAFIIPFSLGYGQNSFSSLPAYSTLFFDIKLERVVSNPEEYEAEVLSNFISDNYADLEPEAEGYYFIEDVEGEGELIAESDVININYTAYYLNGPAFFTTDQVLASEYGIYSSYNVYGPERIVVGSNSVIKGISYAAKKMKEKGKARIILPSSLAYGKVGSSSVSPYTSIIIDIEIKSRGTK